jgi:TPR repeat protein
MGKSSSVLVSIVVAFALLAGSVAARAVPLALPEPALREELQKAVWPADIVRLSHEYLGRYPRGPSAAQARNALELAERSKRTLERKEVRLYRADFQLDAAPLATREQIHRAALGDKEAALQVARWYESGDGGVATDPDRYVGWLQFAAALGNAVASYELALYYRKEDQPALAAPYEARAEELGFRPPPSLDHIRK